MIFGVGVDMVLVARIEAAIARFGDRFIDRILTEHERERYDRKLKKPEELAKCFAAKEATSKALGTGFRLGISWREIEVRHNERGRPFLNCTGRVAELFDEFGVGEGHLSLCDESEYAIAFVTLMRL